MCQLNKGAYHHSLVYLVFLWCSLFILLVVHSIHNMAMRQGVFYFGKIFCKFITHDDIILILIHMVRSVN